MTLVGCVGVSAKLVGRRILNLVDDLANPTVAMVTANEDFSPSHRAHQAGVLIPYPRSVLNQG
ncbi:hypothetical protein R2325_16405 [Mycobacteroides chelonae]|uniref:hypothetical protein n=1 Tax=Mycobacteroides chelonae TaxID=1774 RepID=UPI00092A5548|nr:hypothetical protein [Mycobacteroides chelonae]SHW93653.1 Uncharacterised protein [Mycobacteroides abscessus subsp. abscessus]MBV6360436.1 hypothetical protein [Mycobacteroides chelonae]MEC4857157.1 hypothetical protein [Mycobacteroides chelonae]MEC4873567.1 hypothetical protein [Mycobacteroides chelonae]SKL80961.1 Uncharacterised protein [Mycobacteroides abscessus subsp. abscessus]